jgi:uncharacterized protein (DUF1501 family)
MPMSRKMNRKEFMRRSLALAASGITIAHWPSLLRQALAAQGGAPRPRGTAPGGDLLVVVFLRGGADALSFVPPLGGPDRDIYERERPVLKIPADRLLKLDERFGMHPAGKPFHDLFVAGKLAVVHAAGLVADTRSHFDAQLLMELGTPRSKTTPAGWLARHLRGQGGGKRTFEAVAIGGLAPASLQGFDKAVAINSLGGFGLAGNPRLRPDEEEALGALYADANGGWLGGYGREAIGALKALESVPIPEAGPGYPKGEIGNRLRTLAQLLKLDLGTRAATVDMGGWDTHKFQGKGIEGHFGQQVSQLTQAVAAFRAELQAFGHEPTIVVQSEFGRRVKENANQGTDHGHGGVMFVLGERVAGGKVHGEWPGLKTNALYERADLAVANDYRRVLAEVLGRGFGDRKTGSIFPGYTGYRPLGVMKG